MTIEMSTQNSQKDNNNKECKHKELAKNDLSCIVCGMSRYDQLQNKKRLTKKEEKELEDYINQKHWGMIE